MGWTNWFLTVLAILGIAKYCFKIQATGSLRAIVVQVKVTVSTVCLRNMLYTVIYDEGNVGLLYFI